MDQSGGLTFVSTSAPALEIFLWARDQALSYAFTGDPVGPWYEAALPGREAFCMRDVSHQAMGAHLLGLARHTTNMLRRFAAEITDSRDWCSLWEIDRNGRPPATDYRNDDEFWFCLPANFDILDCCWRVYAWTGDRTYLEDPTLLELYRRTVYEHVERWDLGMDRVMGRKRILNTRADPATGSRLVEPRGIPGYDEGERGFTLGFDLLAAMHAGYIAYAGIQELRGSSREAAVFHRRARELERLVDEQWWDPERQRFRDHTSADGVPVHGSGSSSISALHWRLVEDPGRLEAILAHVERDAPLIPPDAVEPLSHVPEVLYRHDRHVAAFRELARMARSPRRAYPEVSFAAVGAIATGLMGIELVDGGIRTTARLPDAAGSARMSGVPVRANLIAVEHEGPGRTSLSNLSGPALVWKPRFLGSRETDRQAQLIVGPGETATAVADSP